MNNLCIQVNNNCNFNCNYCRAKTDEEITSLNLEEIKKFLEEKIEVKNISITGGEPTMYSKLDQFIEYLNDKKYNVNITTNGFFIDKIDLLSKYTNLKTRVSIDGSQKIHDSIRGENSFDTAIETIKLLKSKNVWIGINTVMYPEVVKNFTQLFSVMKGINIDSWAFITPIYENKKTQTINDINYELIFDKIESKIKDYVKEILFWDYLTYPNGYLYVSSNGNIIIPGVRKEQDILIGHISNIDKNEMIKKVVEQQNLMVKSFF